MNNDQTSSVDTAATLTVLIAGAGISGLYCAWKLAQRTDVQKVILFEASPDRLGGRIETETLDGFTAEMGPMRFEPDLQPEFDKLVRAMKISYTSFPGPTPGKIDFPQYKLDDAEHMPDGAPLNAMALLRRGVLLIRGLKLSANDPSGKEHQAFLNRQTEADFEVFRRTGTLHGKALWDMGFWNALSAPGVLSHQALMKIRDTGTFYHMIPDNLNAVEWTIWWLRAFNDKGAEMKGLEGGSAVLVTRLRAALAATRKVEIRQNTTLVSFAPVGAGVVATVRGSAPTQVAGHHLILAMPTAPLKRLSASLPDQIVADLDAVNGFPMIKVFFATKKPYWKRGTPPQTRANRMPTREVHYFRRPAGAPDDGHGMALLYTDRPATEYWRHFAKKGTHDRADVYSGDEHMELKREFARWLAVDVLSQVEAVKAARALSAVTDHGEADQEQPTFLTDEALETFDHCTLDECVDCLLKDVTQYAIRDWAREPYGAANHSWKPGIKSWEVQARLQAFAARNGRVANVHICGEAYSDYSGFIEGALRSANRSLNSIVSADAQKGE